jgi:hypothetical protein
VYQARSLLIVPDGGATNSGWAAFNAALTSMHEANEQLPLGAMAGVNPNMVRLLLCNTSNTLLDINMNPIHLNLMMFGNIESCAKPDVITLILYPRPGWVNGSSHC